MKAPFASVLALILIATLSALPTSHAEKTTKRQSFLQSLQSLTRVWSSRSQMNKATTVVTEGEEHRDLQQGPPRRTPPPTQKPPQTPPPTQKPPQKPPQTPPPTYKPPQTPPPTYKPPQTPPPTYKPPQTPPPTYKPPQQQPPTYKPPQRPPQLDDKCAGEGWVNIPLKEPLHVTAYKDYTVAVDNLQYYSKSAYHFKGGKKNGHITGAQGVLGWNLHQMPDTPSWDDSSYYIDVEFAPYGTPTVLPTEIGCGCWPDNGYQTLYAKGDQPDNKDLSDDKPLILGLKFKTAVDGTITSVRFYKSAKESLTDKAVYVFDSSDCKPLGQGSVGGYEPKVVYHGMDEHNEDNDNHDDGDKEDDGDDKDKKDDGDKDKKDGDYNEQGKGDKDDGGDKGGHGKPPQAPPKPDDKCAGEGWVNIPLKEPLHVSAYKDYTVAVDNLKYYSKSAYHFKGGKKNGHITGAQGVLGWNLHQMPDTPSWDDSSYYIDVEFAPYGTPTVLPTEIGCGCWPDNGYQTLYAKGDQPDNKDLSDDKPLILGLKFKTAVDGTITSVRFYKSAKESLTDKAVYVFDSSDCKPLGQGSVGGYDPKVVYHGMYEDDEDKKDDGDADDGNNNGGYGKPPQGPPPTYKPPQQQPPTYKPPRGPPPTYKPPQKPPPIYKPPQTPPPTYKAPKTPPPTYKPPQTPPPTYKPAQTPPPTYKPPQNDECAGEGWVSIPLKEPLYVSAYKDYTVAVDNLKYYSKSAYHFKGGKKNGHITGAQGVLGWNLHQMPDTPSWDDSSYYIDVEFAPYGTQSVLSSSFGCGCWPDNGYQTLYSKGDQPDNKDLNDDKPLILGLKFKTAVSGVITAVRFYKSAKESLTDKAVYVFDSSDYKPLGHGSVGGYDPKVVYHGMYDDNEDKKDDGDVDQDGDNYGKPTLPPVPIAPLPSSCDGAVWVSIPLKEPLYVSAYKHYTVAVDNLLYYTKTTHAFDYPKVNGGLTASGSVLGWDSYKAPDIDSWDLSTYFIDVEFLATESGIPPAVGVTPSCNTWPGRGYQTLYNFNDAPASIDLTDDKPIFLGVKISPSTDGVITAIRFYKAKSEVVANKTAYVFDSYDGTKLASASTGDYGSPKVYAPTPVVEDYSNSHSLPVPTWGCDGDVWVVVPLNKPLHISAYKDYTVAVDEFTTYSKSAYYFKGGKENGDVRGVQGVLGWNLHEMPDTPSWDDSSYYVDVEFAPEDEPYDVEASVTCNTWPAQHYHTLYTDHDGPDTHDLSDGRPLVLGLKFSAKVDGVITAVRFYRSHAEALEKKTAYVYDSEDWSKPLATASIYGV